MRVLLTGASGLLGYELIRHLSNDKMIQVYAVTRSSLPEDSLGVETINCDFNGKFDIGLLPKEMDAIVHLAMSPDFRVFPEKSIDVFNVNVASTMHLIDYACKTRVKKFIFASSGVYSGGGDISHSEDEPVCIGEVDNLYLATKICGEVLGIINYVNFVFI